MSAEKNTDFIDKFFAEGRSYIDRGDPVQASEKFYKAVEECVKLLAKKHRIPENEEAEREGRWWTRLLTRAARRLMRELGEEGIRNVWTNAFDLHTWGFHERSLSIEDVEQDIPYIEWLINYTEKAVKE